MNKIKYLENSSEKIVSILISNGEDDGSTDLNNQIYNITSKINEFSLLINQIKLNYLSCKEKEKEDECMAEKHLKIKLLYKLSDLYRTKI